VAFVDTGAVPPGDASSVTVLAAGGNARILRCAKTGCGEQPTVVWASEYSVDALAVEDGRLFWPTVNGRTPPGALQSPQILSCPVTGCGDSASYFFTLSNADVQAFTATASTIVWASNQNGDVVACPVTGCAGDPVTLGTDTSPPYLWLLPSPGSLAVGPTAVAWIDYAGNVETCPLSGCTGAPTTIATGVGVFAVGLVVDATNAYWVDLGDRMGGGKVPVTQYTGGAVVSCPLTGCGANPMVLVSYRSWLGSAAMVADDASLYWSAEDGSGTFGQIVRCAKTGCGGTPEVLATTTGREPTLGVAVDAANVYWTDPAAGVVAMRAK
jgi:hypothetical protein